MCLEYFEFMSSKVTLFTCISISLVIIRDLTLNHLLMVIPINTHSQLFISGVIMAHDIRSRKVMVLAHCVLNQNSRVSGLAYYPAVVEEIVDFLVKHDVGILQMTCPEVMYEGLSRKIQTKEQYDTPRFRSLCRQIARSTARLIQEYLRNGVRVLAVLGVEGSPSCGVEEPKGILTEELKTELKKRGITVPFHELNLKAIAADVKWLKNIVKT